MPPRAAPLPRRIDLSLLDALRGLAAFYVMMTHAGNTLWESSIATAAAAEATSSVLRDVLTQGLSYGRQAVLLFFVLSGFCIHYRQALSLASSPSGAGAGYPLRIGSFAWRRLRRLYPPFLVALLATVALDRLGAAINPAFYGGQTPYAHLNEWLGRDRSVAAFLGTLSMQAGVLTAPFGTNDALWTLGYEFWFYVLYPVLLLFSVRLGAVRLLGVVGLVSLGGFVASRLGPDTGVLQSFATVLWCWFIWAAGAFLAEAYVGRVRLPGLRLALPVAVVLLVVLAARPLGGASSWRFGLWGLALAVVLGNLLMALPDRPRRAVELGASRLVFLGSISYSLYVIHEPWVSFLSAWWLSTHARLPEGVELVLVGMATSLGLGAALWYLVERHFVRSPATRPGAARLGEAPPPGLGRSAPAAAPALAP